MKKVLLAIIAIPLILNIARGNSTSTDSIQKLVKASNNRIETLLDVARSYRDTANEKAEHYALMGLQEAQHKNDHYWQGMAYASLASVMVAKGNQFEKSIELFKRAIVHFKKIGDKEKEARVLNNIGMQYDLSGSYKIALDYYLKALQLYQEIDFKKGIAEATHNVAVIYDIIGEFDQAIDYYKQSANLAQQLGDTIGMSMSLTNLAFVDLRKGSSQEALDLIDDVLKLRVAMGDSAGIALLYNNLCDIFFDKGEIKVAEDYLLKSIAINKRLGIPKRLATNYYNMSFLKDELRQTDEAIRYALLSLEIAEAYNYQPVKLDLYAILTDLYQDKKDYKNALDYSSAYITLYDSIQSANKLKDVQQLKEQYESEKKEQQLVLEKNKRQLAEESESKTKAISQRKSIFLAAVAIVGLLVLVLAIAFYKSAKARKASNQLLEQKNKAINHQKHLLEEKHKEITDSINYAKRIQTALLTSDTYWNQISKDNFVLFRPKEVVSGDFFWAYETQTQQGQLAIWCAADCTGHGVPGAFMSMLGIGFLNEIVIENNIVYADEILNKLREKIIRALEQKTSTEVQKDGMDIALCVWNKKSNTLYYSGANNPLWLIRKDAQEIEEFKADKMPVGSHTGPIQSFTVKSTQLHPGDSIYVFSDGYADQFGGENGKKFKYAQFKSLLMAVNHLDMTTQKEKIDQRFDEWKGRLEQIDDVCVIGVRV